MLAKMAGLKPCATGVFRAATLRYGVVRAENRSAALQGCVVGRAEPLRYVSGY